MAAYSAVISLLQTLEQLQSRNPESLHGVHARSLESLHAAAQYFQLLLDDSIFSSGKYEPEKIKCMEEKIRVAASDAEVVVLKICKVIKGWNFGMARNKTISWMMNCYQIKHPAMNWLPVVENIDTATKELMKMVSDFTAITSATSTTADDGIVEYGDSLIGTSSTSNTPIPNMEDDMVVGLDDDLEIIVARLTGPLSDLDIITIIGMGGIGKTTLARKAYDHLTIRYRFDIHAWVTISQEFRIRNVLLDALHCISQDKNIVNGEGYDKKSDDELADLVQKNLKGRRYLVVVDDIWSTDVWDSIRAIFPDYNNRSRIILTTRETEVAMYANPTIPHEMHLLNVDNSWKLLRDKVFGPKYDHPPELEEIGKKIVGKCQGLPLTISVIAGYLSKVARTLECWKDVAHTLGEIVASHPDKCLGVLGLSYRHLPIHLKPCFLSMGGFPEDFQVETRTLILLWIAEGFIWTTESCRSLEGVADDYLKDLISRNLIMVGKRRFNGKIKTCGIHDLLREFCLFEVEMTQFMHVERSHDIVPTLPMQRRNVHRFSCQTKSYSVENCRKLLPPTVKSIYLYHQLKPSQPSPKRKSVGKFSTFHFIPSLTPCPLIFDALISRFNLLRVLAIFNHRFPSFPLVITKLSHLRYLAITFDKSLPESISELQNLQTLIYKRPFLHVPLPAEIWMMKNLRHIHFLGSCELPSPKSIGKEHLMTGMPHLEELYGLSSNSCTNEFFSGVPHLKRLVVRRVSSRSKSTNDLFDMSSLRNLEAFKCYSFFILPRYNGRFVFPTSLRRLSLGRLGLTWEDISSLVMLPNLEELKLKHHAVDGEVWRLSDEDKFQSLKYLLISQQATFEHWEASSDNFPNLKRLVLKRCDNLKEIPIDFGEIFTLETIELHNCCTAAEDCATKIEQEQEDMGNNFIKVFINYNL